MWQRHKPGLEGEMCQSGVIREDISVERVLTLRWSDEDTGKPTARDRAAK